MAHFDETDLRSKLTTRYVEKIGYIFDGDVDLSAFDQGFESPRVLAAELTRVLGVFRVMSQEVCDFGEGGLSVDDEAQLEAMRSAVSESKFKLCEADGRLHSENADTMIEALVDLLAFNTDTVGDRVQERIQTLKKELESKRKQYEKKQQKTHGDAWMLHGAQEVYLYNIGTRLEV